MIHTCPGRLYKGRSYLMHHYRSQMEEQEVVRMVCERSVVFAVVVAILSLVSNVQAQDRRDGESGGSPPMPDFRPAPPMNVASPIALMRQQAEELRARAREAQELSDRLRRQADELDQMSKQQIDRGGGPQDMERAKGELAEIKEAIDRAEREGRRQDADELRRRSEQLMGRFLPMQSGPGMDERQEVKRQIKRLRDEARMAKEQGRIDDSNRLRQEADRLEQQLWQQTLREEPEFGREMPPEVQDILQAARQAEREGRMDDARRQREKAEIVARQFREQRRGQDYGAMGPRGNELERIKQKIEHLRGEAQKAKEEGRFEEADRVWKEADRLERQLREQGSSGTDQSNRLMAPEVQDILRSAEQAEREGRMDDARRQREKAEIVARQLQKQERQDSEQPDGQFKDELIRGVEELKKEIGRLWQAVNEMRNRPKEDKSM
jgi:hypothetical protein